MSGLGSSFINAGYSFPKPLIDINGKTMIQTVIENLRPKVDHKFIFVCLALHYEKFALNSIFENTLKGEEFKTVILPDLTKGAACTALMAIDYINNTDELIIANSDQVIDEDINKVIKTARTSGQDGLIVTFNSNHPRWSYVRVDKQGRVLEAAEKKVISSHATAGIYYFKHGSDYITSAEKMIQKNIRFNNEFYVCPVYNEMILADKAIGSYEIPHASMHSLGTPEDLSLYLSSLSAQK